MAVINGCSLEHLPVDLSANARSVYELSLRDRPDLLREVDIGILDNLRCLDLSFCELSTFPLEVTVIRSLMQISVSNNLISKLPAAIGNLLSLEILDLSFNLLQALPAEIGALASLEVLNLFHNVLRELPDSIGNLRNLIVLSLSENDIYVIPESIKNLTKLEYFLVGKNLLGGSSQIVSTSLFPARFRINRRIYDAESLQEVAYTRNETIAMQALIIKMKSLKSLDISDCNWCTLPDGFSNLQKMELLVLNNNPLRSIASPIIALKNLVALRMQHCRLKNVPDEIATLSMLSTLNLSNNELTALPSTLGRLTKLESLIVSENPLGNFPPGIEDVSSLMTLELQQCDLHDVPADIVKLKKLTCLALGNNPLEKFSPYVAMLTTLETLNMQGCGIREVPPGISSLSQLKNLNVSWNPLPNFPSAIAMLPSLIILDIRKCSLREIPLAIENLKKLEYLAVGENPLRLFPQSLAKLPSLVKLEMVGCELCELPPAIAKLSKLKELNVSNNLLHTLPEDIGDLVQLNLLIASGNPITKLPERIEKLTELVVLDVGTFPIGVKVSLWESPVEVMSSTMLLLTVVPQTIGKLAMLTSLLLTGNNLQHLPSEIGNLSNLRCLNVSHNNLLELPSSMGQLQQLVELFVAQNKLSSLPENIGLLKKLFLLDMHGNTRLRQLPKAVSGLTQLRTLHVAACGLSKGLRSLERLLNLDMIDLGTNVIGKSGSKVLHRLIHLRVLHLRYCGLEHLPLEMASLKYLEDLDVTGNAEIRSFPLVIMHMTNLRRLSIACCSISEIPPTIVKLKHLTSVFAGNNCFRKFPSDVLQLRSITTLDFSNKRLGPGVRMNAITKLPPELADMPTPLSFLNLEGNAMEVPPIEICALGMVPIQIYLRAVNIGGVLFSEDSVSMLGDPESGKSSLVLSLKKRKPSRTEEADRASVLQQDVVKLGDHYVNFNDFGGHPIYHSVLPLFLRRQGVGILTYNMSEPQQIQEEKVRKWIATVVSRSPAMHLIVVGTHADLIANHSDHAKAIRHMTAFVKDTFSDLKTDIQTLLSKREERPVVNDYNYFYSNEGVKREECEQKPCDLSASLNKSSVPQKSYEEHLEEQLQALEKSSQVVLSVSCQEELSGCEISKVENAILQKIKRGSQMPVIWANFMKSLLKHSDLEQAPCLSRNQVKVLFKKFVGDCQDLDGALNIVLQYLVSTSRIIWLKDNSQLSDLIFHRVEAVLQVCRALLCDRAPPVPDMLKPHLEQYNQGIITEDLLRYLLRNLGSNYGFFKELLMNFNILCQACGGNKSLVIPCRLPEEDPEMSYFYADQERAVKEFLPFVHIRINFLTSLIPLALFETSLVSLISDVKASGKAEPSFWRNGMFYVMDSLRVHYERIESAIDVKAIVQPGGNIRDLWKELHWFVGLIAKYILQKWPSALPWVNFVCPFKIYFPSHNSTAFHGRDATLQDLQSCDKPPVTRYFCKTCRKPIPLSFLYMCKPEHLGSEELKVTDDFLLALKQTLKLPIVGQGMTVQQKLKDNIRKLRPYLITNLTKTDVIHVVDMLLASDHLTEEEKDKISNTDASDAARNLLDCLGKKSEKAVCDFVNYLASDYVRRSDLTEKIQSFE